MVWYFAVARSAGSLLVSSFRRLVRILGCFRIGRSCKNAHPPARPIIQRFSFDAFIHSFIGNPILKALLSLLQSSMFSLFYSVLLLPFISAAQVQAHPGAVAEGRATCGVEYSTSDAAYVIPDIAEAWYIRRVSTCESPVFWTKFEVTSASQQLYISAISPEIDRFRDQLQFHGILYGPGVGEDEANGLAAIPSTLPSAVTVRTDLGGTGYLKAPESLATCDFVDTNPVMKDFSDVIGGRCMEQFTFDASGSDGLTQGRSQILLMAYDIVIIIAVMVTICHVQYWTIHSFILHANASLSSSTCLCLWLQVPLSSTGGCTVLNIQLWNREPIICKLG